MTQEEFFSRYTYDVNTDKIGIGTFGTVYKAYDTLDNRFVALKISEVKTIGNKKFSLADEFGMTSNLPVHPNIARYEHVSTFIQPTGTYDFAVMPYYSAGSLRDILQDNPPEQKDKEFIALQILDGLEFLHSHNVIHRDLKPSNILMEVHSTTQGTTFTPKIADFGLSKVSEPDNKSRFNSSFEGGTLQYSSPEQLKGEPIRHNTDLWSWGVISYKLLTGKELFPVESNSGEIQTMMKILEEDVTSKLAELPDNWRIALHDAMVKDPAMRIKSASVLKNILSGNLQEQIGAIIIEEEDYEEVVPEEFEVVTEDEPSVATPQPKPANNTPAPQSKPTTTAIETDKSRSKKWLYVVLALICLPVLYYFLSDSQFFGHSLSEKKAESILTNMMEYRSNGDFDRTSEVFAEKADKYFSENDVSRSNIVADMEKFAESWSFENVKIVDFGRTVENMFHFTMTYDLRDKKTLQITSYKVSGEAGFIRENDQYKINYITNRGVSNNRNEFTYSTIIVRKQQDFTDYMLTYNASVLFLPEIKDEFLLNYIYSDIFTQNPEGFTKVLLQKAIQEDYIDFINFSENQMRSFVFDSVTTYSKQIEMTTVFVDAAFLSLQVVENTVTGLPVSKFSLSYKNIDYAEGKVLTLSDVLNVDAVPWSDLILKAINSRTATAGSRTISAEEITSLPEASGNFYFDTKKIFFVYGPDQIPEAAEFGPVTVAVPLKEIEKYLTSYFKSKIFNSSKVNVKKI